MKELAEEGEKMTDEERIERLENKLKEALSWWRAAEKQLLQKCKETKTNQKTIERLKAENAALRERLEKALELPRIERLFNGKVGSYKVVYQDKNNRITSEYYSEEKREAAEARLAELKGEKNG